MKRALLIIDVQNDYVDGGLPIEYPSLPQSLVAIGLAMDSAEAFGVPIVVVQTLLPVGSPIFAATSPGAALHPSIAGRQRDLLLEKPLPSCLAKTPLKEWLAERHIDTLTLAGYMTHNCVDATARHASHLGYDVEILADATGSVSYANSAGATTAEELYRVSLTALEARFARVMTTGAWRGLLPEVASTKPTGIWQSYRNAVAKGRFYDHP